MRFNADQNSDLLSIRGYADGELRVQDATYRGCIIIAGRSIIEVPGLRRAADLGREQVERLLSLDPQVVLIGTPQRDDWPAAQWRAQLLAAGIGVEVMNTGAACRTFNVLIAEQRRVAALLILQGP